MAWTKEIVERKLVNTRSFEYFIENGGCLQLSVCGVSLLFYANCDNTVSAYFEYIPSSNNDIESAKEFCMYAKTYLKTKLSQRSDNSIMTSHCIKPIVID